MLANLIHRYGSVQSAFTRRENFQHTYMARRLHSSYCTITCCKSLPTIRRLWRDCCCNQRVVLRVTETYVFGRASCTLPVSFRPPSVPCPPDFPAYLNQAPKCLASAFSHLIYSTTFIRPPHQLLLAAEHQHQKTSLRPCFSPR